MILIELYTKIYRIKVQEYDFEDLINDKEPLFEKNRKFRSWEEYLAPVFIGKYNLKHKTKKEYSTWLVRKIVITFLKLMLEDIIWKNASFVLYKRLPGRIQIGYRPPKNKRDPLRFIKKHYIPTMSTSKKFYDLTNVRYYFVFEPPYKRRLREAVKAGKVYEKTIYEHSSR